MEPLIVKPTETSPGVILDPNRFIFELSGESRPENARDFYSPIIKWLEEYGMVLYWKKNELKLQTGIVVDFKYDYFNSTSAKYILDILLILQKLNDQGHDVMVNWYYEDGDLDIKEAGEEFLSSVSLPHTYVIL